MLEQRVVRRYENRSYSDMCRPPWLYRETSHSLYMSLGRIALVPLPPASEELVPLPFGRVT